MIAVLQRVSEAEVTILGQVAGQIGEGLMILLGIEDADDLINDLSNALEING